MHCRPNSRTTSTWRCPHHSLTCSSRVCVIEEAPGVVRRGAPCACHQPSGNRPNRLRRLSVGHRATEHRCLGIMRLIRHHADPAASGRSQSPTSATCRRRPESDPLARADPRGTLASGCPPGPVAAGIAPGRGLALKHRTTAPWPFRRRPVGPRSASQNRVARAYVLPLEGDPFDRSRPAAGQARPRPLLPDHPPAARQA